jgi:2-oxoacid:acceptor oxidoreductase gamma subunit (pyruvate/2-ketoisovalerate family)
MIEIRWHGRGGQGSVTASVVLAKAAVIEGRWAQAFPFFGMERRGAPVLAFTRMDDKPITVRSGIYCPDIIVVLDELLPFKVDVTSGLKKDGLAVFNTKLDSASIKSRLKLDAKVATVNATRIARAILRKPIVNIAMLGALIRANPLVKLSSVESAVFDTFSEKVASLNVQAMKEAYNEVRT